MRRMCREKGGSMRAREITRVTWLAGKSKQPLNANFKIRYKFGSVKENKRKPPPSNWLHLCQTLSRPTCLLHFICLHFFRRSRPPSIFKAYSSLCIDCSPHSLIFTILFLPVIVCLRGWPLIALSSLFFYFRPSTFIRWPGLPHSCLFSPFYSVTLDI